MDRKYIQTLLFLISLLWIVAGQAVEMRDLDTVVVPVSDRSATNLNQGFIQAFEAALIKMSGNTSVMTIPLMREAGSKVHRYVKSYRYEESDATSPSALRLRVIFDTNGLHYLLKQAKQGIWGSDRPLTLIWLSVPEQSERRILAHEMKHPAILALNEMAATRGVPILFPMMDLEDQNNAIWHIDTALPTAEQIKAIFQRYGVDSVLAGSVVLTHDQHAEGEWRLFLNGKPYEWQTSAPDLAQVVKNGLDRAADMMAIQFATIESGGMRSRVLLKVTGVSNLSDYVHVLAKLKALAPVTEVYVSEMRPNSILLKITTVGGGNDLVEALKTVSHLAAETAPPESGSQRQGLLYRWINTVPSDHVSD